MAIPPAKDGTTVSEPPTFQEAQSLDMFLRSAENIHGTGICMRRVQKATSVLIAR